MISIKSFRFALTLAAAVLTVSSVSVAPAQGGTVMPIEGLDHMARASFDDFDVPSIFAETDHDGLFLQGYLHARDRFFQMDVQRRAFSGTLAELFGSAVVPQDVQLRTLGLRRAAEASLAVAEPEALLWLTAYSEGVNAWLADTSQPLPFEYGALETDRDGIPAWTPLDSLTVAKGLAFNLAFDLEDIDRTIAFLTYNTVFGFQGIPLFFTDLYRAAPFDPTISIPQTAATGPAPGPGAPGAQAGPGDGNQHFGASHGAGAGSGLDEGDEELTIDAKTLSMLTAYREKIAGIPILEQALETSEEMRGSNWFLTDGDLSDTGNSLIAHDPHLGLDQPATFVQNHLNIRCSVNAAGTSFPGVPGVVLGCNDDLCWGATVNPMDVTDVYQEVLIAQPVPGLPPGTPTHTFFRGNLEPMLIIPQQFFVNIIGDSVLNNTVDAGVPPDQGGVTFIVPRRNFGAIVQVDASDPQNLSGFSVAYTGNGATHEVEAFRRINKAKSIDQFRDAIQYFDVGSQNFGVVDTLGNIAYFTSAELPIREDLQLQGGPDGLQGPFLIRDGSGTLLHEWLPVANPQPNQSLPTEILPFDEMPQTVNPDQGYVLNANNDPIGTTLDNFAFNQFRVGGGALYLSAGYAAGFRIGRIQQLYDDAIANDGKVSLAEMQEIQANNQLLDAEVFLPYLETAWTAANDAGAAPEVAAFATDPRLVEAMGRLSTWDFSTPTGIMEGFDPGDDPFAPAAPDQAEIDASVAATIYSTWRGQFVQRVIDGVLNPIGIGSTAPGSSQAMAAVRNLLDNYAVGQGFGASGIDFFNVPGVADRDDSRDIIILGALSSALDLLASNDFAAAFGNSTDQEDYRWGKLHRIVFDSFIGPPFSIPTAGGFPDLGPGLPGISRAGGLGAVDASAHSARADGVNEFMFGSGPARRLLAEMTHDGPIMQEVIPGGQSGNFLSPHQTDQLRLWLVNDNKPVATSLAEAADLAAREEFYKGCPPSQLLDACAAIEVPFSDFERHRLIQYSTTSTCGPISVEAVVQPNFGGSAFDGSAQTCDLLSVSNGQTLDVECGGGACSVTFDDPVIVEGQNPVLIVTATDGFGGVASCMADLCTPDETEDDAFATRDLYFFAAAPGALLYEVARSTSADFSSCDATTSAKNFVVDQDLPGTGQVFYYLSRASMPTQEPWGTDSSGQPRAVGCGN